MENVISIENRIENKLSVLVRKKKIYLILRRAVELVFIILISPLIIIMMTLISIILIISCRSWFIFTQVRAGTDGKPFRIYKFRTMLDCMKSQDNLFVHDENNITKIGSLLRKHRLDELPQFWNVLKGEMSIFGPRPEIWELYIQFKESIKNYKLRKLVPQGITGWAQINTEHTVTIEGNQEKLNYDLEYIENLSFWLDLKIAFWTLIYMFTGKYSK